ncbi:MAG: class I SAM-dependent methyltransferase, partial [Candidatus Methanomethylophilaceae archaeon]|nr:class I SAM-dependent methyltransferase [Candidatus Methanomethylophilaceae archaeon]MDD4245218.1 class I SAM-dependent methyltransferase [Candidatus Methanomethylophilaceae archaeon]MDD4455462.1 class I SAM-dependent methyltransferase [Candidatus Methanomethylophilaceae archaeon]
MNGISQYGKPEGEEGRRTIFSMNAHHRKLSEWALSFIKDAKPAKILDIGCGGGMQMSLMRGMFPEADITGLDHSPEAVAAASEANSDAVTSGKCRVMEGSVEGLP